MESIGMPGGGSRPTEGGGANLLLGQLVRFFLVSLAVVGLVALMLEATLRLLGEKPLHLGEAGLAATIPDPWMEWRMRPGVRDELGRDWPVTNRLGFHHARPVHVQKPPGTHRVMICGSSVVYGPGMNFPDTIPEAAQAALLAAGGVEGLPTEVINAGMHGFTIRHTTAFLMQYGLQFDPDAVVVVCDLQLIYPRWVSPDLLANAATPETTSIKQLGLVDGAIKRLAGQSALFRWIDDPTGLRDLIATRLHLPQAQAARAEVAPSVSNRFAMAVRPSPTPKVTPSAPASPAPEEAFVAAPLRPADREDHRRFLTGQLSALAAFCQGQGLALFLVTPYGPYHEVQEEDLRKFSLNMLQFLLPAYDGHAPRMLLEESEASTQIIRDVARRYGAQVIDMAEFNRRETLQNCGKFSADGVHLSAEGNRFFGAHIASEILRQARR